MVMQSMARPSGSRPPCAPMLLARLLCYQTCRFGTGQFYVVRRPGVHSYAVWRARRRPPSPKGVIEAGLPACENIVGTRTRNRELEITLLIGLSYQDFAHFVVSFGPCNRPM